MSDNRRALEYKTLKRVVSWREMPDFNTENIVFNITYILDSGELINDVNKKYYETVICRNLKCAEKKEKTLRRSRDRLIRDLEQKIRATGATRFNAKKTARNLLCR